MKDKLKTVFLFVSIALNLVFIFIFFMTLLFSQGTSSLSFYDPGEGSRPFVTAAAIVTFPSDSGSVVFEAVEITLKKGESAALQFSAVAGRRQANWLISALYDHGIITTKETGYGVLITALGEGETAMQTLTGEGIKDMAFVKVLP
jgi:hypothetical protein